MAEIRSFAIVPAAGSSARMGAPKLMLPLGGRPLLEHALAVWIASRVTRIVVVVRKRESHLLEVFRGQRIDIVPITEATLDMKASVRLAVRHIRQRYSPTPHDAWLLAPADMPCISPLAIDAFLREYKPRQRHAIVPTFDGERGHPALFPWSCVDRLNVLKAGEGVNALLRELDVREVPWYDDSVLRDVDTPEEYAEVAAMFGVSAVAG
jgi:molybdenum cofactor cytidylyltransferase